MIPRQETASIAALVLAGGRSSRMGSAKEEIVLGDGRTMLSHVLDALRPLGIPIRLSTGRIPTDSQIATGLPLVPDTTAFEGPLAAIARALGSYTEDGLLVVGCDQPLLRAELLERLLAHRRPSELAFFQSAGGRLLSPLPGYYPRTLLSDMVTALDNGERSPRRWAGGHQPAIVRIKEEEALMLRSFNTLEALEKAGLLGE